MINILSIIYSIVKSHIVQNLKIALAKLISNEAELGSAQSQLVIAFSLAQQMADSVMLWSPAKSKNKQTEQIID